MICCTVGGLDYPVPLALEGMVCSMLTIMLLAYQLGRPTACPVLTAHYRGTTCMEVESGMIQGWVGEIQWFIKCVSPLQFCIASLCNPSWHGKRSSVPPNPKGNLYPQRKSPPILDSITKDALSNCTSPAIFAFLPRALKGLQKIGLYCV